MTTTVIKNLKILSMEKENGSIKPPFAGNILIEGDKISYIGDTLPEYSKLAEVIDGSGMLAMPGLINAHTHAIMTLFRGWGDDMELMSWLEKRIWPIEDKLTDHDAKAGAALAVAEMIKSGTTAFADMYMFCEQLAEVAASGGIRASIAAGISDNSMGKLPDIVDFACKYQGLADGLITTMLGPHAPFTCNKQLLTMIAAAGRRYNLPLHIHLAETLTELEIIEERYECTPARLLADCGFFEGNKSLLAHGVYLSDEDMDLLAGKDLAIVHNPISNLKLASGIAPVAELLDRGITVALGTDSACSNNNLDMFEEIKTAAIIAKVKDLDPTVIPAAEALQMAISGGAKALGLEDVGELKAGMKADLILIDLNKTHFAPEHDLLSHLVYAAHGDDVDTVIVNGQTLMRSRQLLTMDEEKIIAEAKQTAKRLCYDK